MSNNKRPRPYENLTDAQLKNQRDKRASIYSSHGIELHRMKRELWRRRRFAKTRQFSSSPFDDLFRLIKK